MEIHVSLVGRQRLADQVRRQLADHIARGSVAAGAPLPSTRELAGRLGVSRNTVVAAYERLMADGLVGSRAGVGYFVREARPRPARPAAPMPAAGPEPAQVWARIEAQIDQSALTLPYDFRSGVPSGRHFPYAKWRALLSDHVRPTALRGGGYGDPAGEGSLRQAIAHHVALSRAVRVHVDDVIVTTGTQQSVDLVARAVLAPGDTAVIEDPGYSPVRALLLSHRARVVGVPVDPAGLVVDALPEDARLVYVTPSHQYPLGMSMTLDRRRDLLAWAARRQAVIVEDDYDSEYRYVGRPIEPLQSIDTTGSVVYIGSFSKVLLPTFRLGFVVAPPSLRPALVRAKYVTDWHTNGVMQRALASFITDGSLAKHIRAMRHLYLGRHHALVGALDADFAELLEPIPSLVGLHVTARLRPAATSRTDAEISVRAGQLGVGFNRLSALAWEDTTAQGLVLGYGAIEQEDIPAGLDRLRRAIR